MNTIVRSCLGSGMLLVLLAGSSMAQDTSLVASHPMIGEPAPGFGLNTVTGDSLALADLKGMFLVVHFGASW